MPHIPYVVNGETWPSATELTSLLPQPWMMAWYKSQVRLHGWRGWQKCLAQTKRGGTIGTEVHTLLESFITKVNQYTPISGKYNSEQFADALFDKVNPLVDEWIYPDKNGEPHLISNELKIHGTADMIVRLNYETGLWIGDWKTSAQKSGTHAIQLAIYALCWNEQHPDQEIDKGFIARVDKKSKRLTVHIDEYKGLRSYYPVIQALRTIWQYSRGEKS